MALPHVSARRIPEGQRPECAGLTFFDHPQAERGSLNKQKAPITRGKKDESTQSKMRKLRVTEHAINTAMRPPDAEATFTTRVASGGLTPGSVEDPCTPAQQSVKKEGQPGGWRGREPAPALPRAPPSPGYAGQSLSKTPLQNHQVGKNSGSADGVLVRLWSTGSSPSEGRAAGISGTVRDPAGAARACPGPSR